MLLIIDCGSSKKSAIKDAVSSRGFSYKVVKLSLLSPEHIKEATGIIISGAPILLTDSFPSLFAEKFSFLKHIHVPVLGICFGHQVMGLVFGETVFLGKEVRGEERIELLFDDPLFEGIAMPASFTEDHTEGIGLPDDDFFLLASSQHYEVEAMKHKKKDMYGVQFHPEASGAAGQLLLENFLKICLKRQMKEY